MPPDRSPDRICLFLDVDGSLIDIAPRPDAVVVPATLLHDLERATVALDGALALVSGRSIAQIDALFSPLRLRASGVHGAETRFDPGEAIAQIPDGAISIAARDEVAALVGAFPGTLLEDKVYSVAVHYRSVPTVAKALIAALEAVCDRHPSDGLTLLPGHFVVELKRPSFDKGTAVRRFLDHPRFAGRMPIFVGDDVTDRPGFAAALAAGGTAYGVGQEIAGTTGTFDSPSAVRRWLATIGSKETMPA